MGEVMANMKQSIDCAHKVVGVLNSIVRGNDFWATKVEHDVVDPGFSDCVRLAVGKGCSMHITSEGVDSDADVSVASFRFGELGDQVGMNMLHWSGWYWMTTQWERCLG